MKKFLVILLVLVVTVMTMVSCADEPKPASTLEVETERVIIDDVNVGYFVNYGDYYVFTAISVNGYLVFLDTYEANIEIIDISTYDPGQSTTERYVVTYKLLNNN